MTPTCPICGKEMWDNREKKASGEFKTTAPDFRCKEKTCEGVVWPEKKELPPTPHTTPKTQEPIREALPDWESIKVKEQEGMMRMSALKAASEVVSAYISRPDSPLPESLTELMEKIFHNNLLLLKDSPSKSRQRDVGQAPDSSEGEF
jgi:hypothetical protein